MLITLEDELDAWLIFHTTDNQRDFVFFLCCCAAKFYYKVSWEKMDMLCNLMVTKMSYNNGIVRG